MEGSGKEKMEGMEVGVTLGEACCWMPITSYWHLGSLSYLPHAPQPVGLTPAGLTCLLSAGTDLGDVYLFIQSVLRTALWSGYACDCQVYWREPRLREVT